MKFPHSSIRGGSRGFTLTELLVTIAIVGTLATIAFLFARKGLEGAANSRSMSHMRQSGALLLIEAQEKNGRFQYYGGGGSAGWDMRHYNIVRNALGLKTSGGEGNRGDLCEIMHWNPVKLKPNNYHWNCFAVNFTNVPDFGAVWQNETIPTPVSHSARTLLLSSVTSPDRYPLLATSSTSTGEEIFRILESNGDLVALRANGRAQVFMMDGSAREMNRTELKAARFTRAYDTRTKPPKSITL